MSETVLKELFGIGEGYEVTRVEHEADLLRLHLDVADLMLVCPECGGHEVSRKGRRHRELQTVPVGLTPVYLMTEVTKCQCRDCHHRFEVAPPLPRPTAGSPTAWWLSCRRSPR